MPGDCGLARPEGGLVGLPLAAGRVGDGGLALHSASPERCADRGRKALSCEARERARHCQLAADDVADDVGVCPKDRPAASMPPGPCKEAASWEVAGRRTNASAGGAAFRQPPCRRPPAGRGEGAAESGRRFQRSNWRSAGLVTAVAVCPRVPCTSEGMRESSPTIAATSTGGDDGGGGGGGGGGGSGGGADVVMCSERTSADLEKQLYLSLE